MATHDTDPFSGRARELLDESTEYTDAASLSRLKQARTQALARIGRRDARLYWVPAGAVTASLLLMGIYFIGLQRPEPAIYQDPVQLEAAENMELLDDLEFVAWLAVTENS